MTSTTQPAPITELAAPVLPPLAEHTPTASGPRRMLAHLIDLLAVAGLGSAVYLPTGSVLLGALLVAEGVLALLLWEARTGRTLGKSLFGLRTIQLGSDAAPGLGRVLRRAGLLGPAHLLALVGQFLLIGTAALDSSGRGRAWHDRLAGTRVIDLRPAALAAGRGRASRPRERTDGAPQAQSRAGGEAMVPPPSAPPGSVPAGPPVIYGQVPTGAPPGSSPGQMPTGPSPGQVPSAGSAPAAGYAPAAGQVPPPPEHGYGFVPGAQQGPARQAPPLVPSAPGTSHMSGVPGTSPAHGAGAGYVPPPPAPAGHSDHRQPGPARYPQSAGSAPPPGPPARPAPDPGSTPGGPPAPGPGVEEVLPEDSFFPTAETASAKVSLDFGQGSAAAHEPAQGPDQGSDRAPDGAVYVLTIDDGTSVTVTGVGLIGRNPQPRGAEEIEHLVAVDDPGRSLSRTHARVGVDDEQFFVEDLGSANGTAVVSADGVSIRVFPGEKVAVPPEGQIQIGERSITVAMWQR